MSSEKASDQENIARLDRLCYSDDGRNAGVLFLLKATASNNPMLSFSNFQIEYVPRYLNGKTDTNLSQKGDGEV